MGDMSCAGTGPKKKAAKRDAAEKMLEMMGMSNPGPPQPEKGSLKTSGSNSGAEKKPDVAPPPIEQKKKVPLSEHSKWKRSVPFLSAPVIVFFSAGKV